MTDPKMNTELRDQLRRALPANKLGTSAEYDRRAYHVTVANNVRLADILRPGYWMNFCGNGTAKLAPGTVIDVVREDMSLDVSLRVTKVGVGFAVVRERFPAYVDDSGLEKPEASFSEDDPALEIPEGYKVGHAPRGENAGYWVKLTATGAMVKVGIQTKVAACAIAREHAKQAGNIPAETAAA